MEGCRRGSHGPLAAPVPFFLSGDLWESLAFPICEIHLIILISQNL